MDHAIRLAQDADLPAITAIVEEAYAPYVERIGKRPGPMEDDYAARIRQNEAHVLEIDGLVAGLLVLLDTDNGCLLDNVAIASSFQDKGLGKTLVIFAETEARSRGHKRIKLYTHALMTENRNYYPRLGYRETGQVTEKGFDRVYFEKDLG